MTQATRLQHVLAVDDDCMNLDVIRILLTSRGHEVRTAACVAEARRLVADVVPDIVLLDVCMPGTSGLEYLRELREDSRTQTVPVIMMSALSDTDDVVRGLEYGANDYVTKPIDLPVLLARFEAHVKLGQMLRQLEVQAEDLTRMASLDELTGAYNRRSMSQLLDREVERCRLTGRAMSVLMLDLDRFKAVNDAHGHGVGDEVLRELSTRVARLLRRSDALCRYGGEEFVVILPDSGRLSAESAAERIRRTIAESPFATDAGFLPVTASIGVALYDAHSGADAQELVERADRALYQAKRDGRNCVRLDESGVTA